MANEILKTDVLVIGGGAAGIRAAIEAEARGFQVLVLNKGLVGKSGITPMASDGISAAINPDDSIDVLYNESCRVSRGIGDRTLLHVLAYEAVDRVRELIAYGAKFRLEEDGRLFHPTRAGKRDNHTCNIIGGGVGLMNALKRALKGKPKVRVWEDTMALRLVTGDGRVAGAIVLDISTGVLTAVSAGAVILATGGYEELWPFTDTSCDSTGEGVVLALDAGADLVDLEMVLFQPFIIIHPPAAKGCFVPYDILSSIGGETLDGKMRNVCQGILPLEAFNRAAYLAIQRGEPSPHGGFYYRSGGAKTISEIEKLLLGRMGGRFTHLQKMGIELQRDLVEMAPSAHYCLGGVRIDPNCGTSVPGLWAAGEVSGNVHGAERLFSNALAETQVFGYRAGRAVSLRSCAGDFEGALAACEEEIREFSGGAEPPLQIRSELQEIMWRMAGPVRRADLLERALKEMGELEKRPLRARTGVFSYPLVAAWETKAMLRLAQAVIGGCLARTESRGHHYREDYPQTKEEWRAHTRVHQTGAELSADMVEVA